MAKQTRIRWANKMDMIKAGFDANSGIVVGSNPDDNQAVIQQGREHVLLMGPTRCGKGINTICPTCFSWYESIFVFDPKGETWGTTSSFRKNTLHQKVLKFQPLSYDDNVAHWNPLAEVRYQTPNEYKDVNFIIQTLIGKESDDPLWNKAVCSTIEAAVLHLFYSDPGPELPSLGKLASFFLSGETVDKVELFKKLRFFPHISLDQFLEKNGENPLKAAYGEYIKDFAPINKALEKEAEKKGKNVSYNCKTIEEVRKAFLDLRIDAVFSDFYNLSAEQLEQNPFYLLLVHPVVHESFSNLCGLTADVRHGVLERIVNTLFLFQNPAVAKNVSFSDFTLKDLLDPEQKISLYLVMVPKDIMVLRQLSKLFLTMILDRARHSDASSYHKQHLLLLLDEFPEFGFVPNIESSLSSCANNGVRICITTQDVNQIVSLYSFDNDIFKECRFQIFFVPNQNSGLPTAEYIAERLGTSAEFVMKMPKEMVIASVDGHPPVKLEVLKFPFSYGVAMLGGANLQKSDVCTSIKTFCDLGIRK